MVTTHTRRRSGWLRAGQVRREHGSRRRASQRSRYQAPPAMPPKTSIMSGVTTAWYCAPAASGGRPSMESNSIGSVTVSKGVPGTCSGHRRMAGGGDGGDHLELKELVALGGGPWLCEAREGRNYVASLHY
eukprot:6193803-Pleurochrysis_carterae.AAC.1